MLWPASATLHNKRNAALWECQVNAIEAAVARSAARPAGSLSRSRLGPIHILTQRHVRRTSQTACGPCWSVASLVTAMWSLMSKPTATTIRGGRGILVLVVLTYADLPEVRAWRASAQLDIAGLFAMRKPESALPILLSELVWSKN